MSKTSTIDTIVKELESGNETAIIGAIEKIPEKGNPKVIEPLLEVYEETTNPAIKERIKQVLCELKDTNCIDPLMDYFRMAETETRELILNAFWNNNLTPYTYIDVFVEAAINGSYMESFEVLTLIENMEANYADVDFKHMVTDLEDAIEDAANEQKHEILKSILEIIQQLKPQA